MNVTMKGEIVPLAGEPPKVGEQAPDFSLVNLHKQIIQLSDLKGQPILLSVVPDIDTRVCQLQTKQFNERVTAFPNVHLLTISTNTRDEQANWCASEGIEMEMLHDTENVFGEKYGLYLPSMQALARAIFVIDPSLTIVYQEIVPEISQEPNYEQALAALKSLQ